MRFNLDTCLLKLLLELYDKARFCYVNTVKRQKQRGKRRNRGRAEMRDALSRLERKQLLVHVFLQRLCVFLTIYLNEVM
jgi:hypothetical protein